MGIVLFTLALLCVAAVASQVMGLRRNIAKAKESGFAYLVVPCLIPIPKIGTHLNSILIPTFKWLSLPEKWIWRLEAMSVDLPYRTRHLWPERLGDDIFLIVAPTSMMLQVCNAEVNTYVAKNRKQFPKWAPAYEILRLFGPNLLTTTGSEWLYHRKLTTGSFNETNTALVFRESVHQSVSMLRIWTGDEGANGSPVQGGVRLGSANDDLTKLMLHIINYVGFGLRMLWPDEELPEDIDPGLVKFTSLTVPPGYTTSFLQATDGVLHNILMVLVCPVWLLERMPFQSTKAIARQVRDYSKYCNELLDKRLADDTRGEPAKQPGMDFLGQVARTSSEDNGSEVNRAAILSNAFVLQVAGHETTARTLYHTLVFLACHPEAQRRVQEDLDTVLGETEPSTWEYGQTVNALLASHVGAAAYETLRMMPPVVAIPKMATRDEVVRKDGKSYTIHKDVPIMLNVMAVGKSARYWPPPPPANQAAGDDAATDLDDYVPARWFRRWATTHEASGKEDSEETEEREDESYDKQLGPVTSDGLFRPARGAFLPFSDGAHSCLGRRVAQAQLMAAMGVIFREYSIELEVTEVEGKGEAASERELYGQAQRRALDMLRAAQSVITLGMDDDKQPVLRLVKRGEERFASWVDE